MASGLADRVHKDWAAGWREWGRIALLSLGPVLVAAVVFKLAISDGGRDPLSLTVAQTAVFAALAVLVWTGRARLGSIGRAMLVMLGVMAITSVTSVRPEASVREMLLWTMYLGIFVTTASTLRGPAAARRMLDALAAIAGWLVVIALFMFWGANNPGMRWYSTFYWPNPFAAFLLLLLPLALVRFLHAVRIRDVLAHGVMTLLLLVSLVLTYSRGAWMALAAVVPLAVILLRAPSWRSVVERTAVLVVTTAIVVTTLAQGSVVRDTGKGIMARATSAADPGDYSVQGRLNFWRAGWEIFRDHPLLGVGPGAFGAAHAAYQRDVRYYARDAHNLFVQALAEMGAAGLVALVLLLAAVFLTWQRTLRAARGREEYPLIVGIGLGLAAFFLHNAVDMDWMFPANPAMAFAAIGVLVAFEFAGGTHGGPRATQTQSVIWLRGAAVLTLVTSLVATQAVRAAQDRFVLGQHAARQGNWSLARSHYAAAVRMNPLSSRFLDAYASASVQILPSQAADAPGALRRAMRLDRMNASHPFRLAVLVISNDPERSEQEEAERLLHRALALDRFNRPETYRALAGLYREQGRFDEAQEVYRQAMDLYLGRNLGKGAVVYMLLWPGVTALFQDAADMAAAGGRFEEAAGVLERLLAEDPTAVGAVLQLSDLYVAMHRYADARALLEATAARVPDHPALSAALKALR